MSQRGTLRSRMSVIRRKTCEFLGIPRFSRPALNQLDMKLDGLMKMRKGLFLEAGAYDGYDQSNTYFLEKFRGWTGILVEPVPSLAAQCRINRPKSQVIQAALVAPDYTGTDIEMHFAGLMSCSQGAFHCETKRKQHLESAKNIHVVEESYSVRVPVLRLSEILTTYAPVRRLDLLSLDVEGSELSALSGLDLGRNPPANILVEARDPDAVERMLHTHYRAPLVLHENNSYKDLFFALR